MLFIFLRTIQAVSISYLINVNFLDISYCVILLRCGIMEGYEFFSKTSNNNAQQALVFSEAVNVLLSWMLPLSFLLPKLNFACGHFVLLIFNTS